MQETRPTLHLLCGKIASGKSTLAKELASTPCTVIIDEDDWLEHLFPGEINSVDDYIRCTLRLRNAMGPHVYARAVGAVRKRSGMFWKVSGLQRQEAADVGHEAIPPRFLTGTSHGNPEA